MILVWGLDVRERRQPVPGAESEALSRDGRMPGARCQPGRLVRQLLAEGLALAALAGNMALALAAGVPILAARLDGTAAMFAPDVVVVAVVDSPLS